MNSIEQEELYSKSNHEIAAALGARFRAYRIALGLTQKDIAEKTGISLITIARFENGYASSIGLSNYIGLLRATGQLERIVDSIPEIPESLFRKKANRQRIRKKRNHE